MNKKRFFKPSFQGSFTHDFRPDFATPDFKIGCDHPNSGVKSKSGVKSGVKSGPSPDFTPDFRPDFATKTP